MLQYCAGPSSYGYDATSSVVMSQQTAMLLQLNRNNQLAAQLWHQYQGAAAEESDVAMIVEAASNDSALSGDSNHCSQLATGAD